MDFGLLGRKLGMTQIFAEDGKINPVTVLESGPCVVLKVKTADTDGYKAVQLGFAEKKKNVNKPLKGIFAAVNVKTMAVIREFRVEKDLQVKAGDTVGASLLEGVQKVDIRSVTKGRGFAGMVKRYNKKRGPESHGSMNVRGPGSIGSNTTPARVLKGKRMPGHMGNVFQTARNLKVVKVDQAKNLLYVRGAVPGPTGAIVEIRESRGKKK